MKSAYDVLGVSKTASSSEIDNAFRQYSKVLHPDVNKRVTAAQEFKELKSAYDTLRDSTKRSEHDYSLAVVETRHCDRDDVDSILDDYSITAPKKKKKKKKKKHQDAVARQYPFEQPVQTAPRHHYPNHGRGNGDFEGIPGGYDNFDDLGGDTMRDFLFFKKSNETFESAFKVEKVRGEYLRMESMVHINHDRSHASMRIGAIGNPTLSMNILVGDSELSTKDEYDNAMIQAMSIISDLNKE